jgi:SPW repeat
VWLFISPWVLTTTGSTKAAENAWIIGAAIFVVALIALGTPRYPTADWVNVVLGVWLFISPWVLGYTGVKDGSWDAWIFGVITVVLALWVLQMRCEVPGGPQWAAGRLEVR